MVNNHSIFVEKLKHSKNIINSQNKKIDSLQAQNKELIKEIEKLKSLVEKVDSSLKSKNSWPPVPAFSAASIPSFARIAAGNSSSTINSNNNNAAGTDTPRTPSTKRPNDSNDSASLNKRSSTITNSNNNNSQQRQLLNFNSFDPQAKNVPISSKKTNDWTTSGDKQKEKRDRNYKNKQYKKSVGLGVGSDLLARKRKFYVYFGNIDIEATNEQVETTLANILDGIQYDDFTELNSDKSDRMSKSFKFSIGYLDKEVINDKNRWPRYTIINKYKMSKVEWDAVAARKATSKTNNNQINSISSANLAQTSIIQLS